MAYMETRAGANGRAKKARESLPEKVHVAVRLSRPLKVRMEIIAAARGESFAAFSDKMIELGLREYLKDGHLDISALETLESAAMAQS